MKFIFRVLFNKFLITGAAFIIWMVYFDQNNWTAQEDRKRELRETERNIAYLNQEIARMEKEHKALTTDPAKLEQFAREHYKMKKDNEDLYIVEQ